MDDSSDQSGYPDDLERPGDTLIRISYYADQTLISIPPRPLIIPLRILLTLHSGSILFLLISGIIYLVFHRSIFTGLPDPPAVFSHTGSHVAEYKWYAEVLIGWVASLSFLVTVFGLVWIPQIATESLKMDAQGLCWLRQGWWKRERIDAAWADVTEIALLGRKPDIAPNRLIIQLNDGTQQPMAENTSNVEREWLEALIVAGMRRFRNA